MKLSAEQLKLFEDLTQAVGVSGHERRVLRVFRDHLAPYVDEIGYDQLGSIYGIKKSKQPHAPKVAIFGHLDEVGFLVKSIKSDGSLAVMASGGLWSQNLLSQRVVVESVQGELFDGVIGSIPPHLLSDAEKNAPYSIDKMLIDIGSRSAQETQSWGIFPGCQVVMKGEFTPLNGGERLLSKAFDNRYGLAIGIDVARTLHNEELPFDLYICGTVQEEVGLRGAKTLASLIDPDFAFVVDCSPANDLGGKAENGVLGGGVLLRYTDKSMIAFPQLLQWQKTVCERQQIPTQYFYSMGGTDAGEVHLATPGGTPTLTHCICARNIHSSGTVMDAGDYLHAQQALVALLRELNRETIEELVAQKR